MKKFLVCLVVFVFFCFFVNAATYYVSYEDGNDSWSGLTKEQPWKKHPYMNGFSGIYVHQPGDRFIFKGGVVWLNDAFPFVIAKHGWPEINPSGSASNPDYYGVDKSWFKGSDWSRPVFDLENMLIADGTEQKAINFNYVNYIIFDNFELKNQRISEPYTGNDKSAGLCSLGSNNLVISNCYIHDWYLDTPKEEMYGGIMLYWSNNIIIDSCHIKGTLGIPPANVTRVYPTSGAGVYNNNGLNVTVKNSEIHDTTQGVFGVDYVYNNHIHHIGDSFGNNDPHQNMAWMNPGGKFYNNIIHDSHASNSIYVIVGWGGEINPAPIWIYNNIIYDGDRPLIQVDPSTAHPTATMRTYIFNNLIFNPGKNYDALIFVGERPNTPPLALLDIRNNLLITDAIKPISLYMSSLDGVVDKNLVANNVFGGYTNYTVSTLIAENNKLLNLSQASALGLTSDNFFNITSTQFVENITNAGQTIICADCTDIDKDILGRDRDNYLPWDIGAYEYETVQSLGICSAYPGERYSNEEISVQIVRWRSGEIDLREMIKRAKIWKYCPQAQ